MNISVIGLGYVGLPTALWLASKGHHVLGVDTDSYLVRSLSKGYTHLNEAAPAGSESFAELLRKCLLNKTFQASTKNRRLGQETQTHLVTVGIPMADSNGCDLGPLTKAITALTKVLAPGDLVIVKSTLIPGSMRKLVLPLLAKADFIPGDNLALAYTPERLAEGVALADLDRVPRLVAAEDEFSLQKAVDFWLTVSDAPSLPVSSYILAELSKVVENIYRDANIAISNELNKLVQKLGLKFKDLQNIANTHPRVNLMAAGPGVGGYCPPNALGYLLPIAQEQGATLDLLEVAREVNRRRPEEIASVIEQISASRPAKSKAVAILGMGMKDNCADTRLSPALFLAEVLVKLGYKVRSYDPLVPEYCKQELSEILNGTSIAVYTALQPGLEPEKLLETLASMEHPPAIVDTKGLFTQEKAGAYGVELYYA